MADDYKYFSADSHFSEPGDLWEKRIDKEFRYRAPRIEALERNGRTEDFLIYENFPPHPVSVGISAARTAPGEQRGDAAGVRQEEALRGGFDPVARLEDQDKDGLEGEVISTTLGFRLFWMKDAKLQAACFRALNDWIAEFCSHNPYRLVGVPAISLFDIDEACREVTRAHKMGLKGAMIGLSPHEDQPPYSSTYYDKFWATCAELDAPLMLHEITGSRESRLIIAYWDENSALGRVIQPHESQRTLATFILSGVFERHPGLKIVSTENGTDWVPWFHNRLSRGQGASSFPTRLSMRPIEYARRNVFYTYINEPDAVKNREEIGIDNLMWASDYPHGASTYPRSVDIVERDTANIPADERRKLIHDNVIKLYNIPVPAYA
jgi:predicted TIM-barrel fold metal-dependent hydrolase